MLALASVLSTAALLNPSGISVQQLRLVYYTRELLEQTEEIYQKCFLPRTGFLLFRADTDIGGLLNPDAKYVSEASIQCGDYLQELKADLVAILLEMDRLFPFRSTATLSQIWNGSADLYQMYLENKNTYDYSWNQPGNLHTYDELCASPMTPKERMDICALEEEFINDINHLLFDEAPIVLDAILQKQFQHATPLSDVTVSTTARLRSVLSVLEFSKDLSLSDLEELNSLLHMTAGVVSVPELMDRVHDFFAAIVDLSPRQHTRKGVQILEFLEANYKNPALNAQMICGRFRISRTYLSRLIKNETGQGLVDCIHQIRLEHAKTLLLETEATIEQVAFQVGFSSRFSLIRAFRDLEHTTPHGVPAESPELLRLHKSRAR